ncbi:paraneoplastic antigen Ma1-like [Pseudophryne corroboree]|uniref:paraneoplastic antigen Ma1-like n=1 Tax=Pseudophryne corroboree TaxID=495146 RepID=UPI0030815306
MAGISKPHNEGSSTEAVMDKVVNQLERWHYEGGYRRLRMFSGIVPVPAGEESYELWKETAIQHSEEWPCTDAIKKQRVVESLRGPAMGVIQATRRSNPQATLREYFEALDFSYRTLEDVCELLACMNHTFQEHGETLTDYIYRVDKVIYKLVEKGGMERSEVDERRLRQVLKGALTTNPVAQRLQCTMRGGQAPTLNELVKEVKLEEVQIENREKTIKKVKLVVPAPSPQHSSIDDRLLNLLEEQNKKIDQLIALQTDRQTQPYMPTGVGRGMTRRNQSPITCYRCGQIGHRSFECHLNEPNNRGNRYNARRRDEQLENSNGSTVVPSQTPPQ